MTYYFLRLVGSLEGSDLQAEKKLYVTIRAHFYLNFSAFSKLPCRAI